MIPTIIRVSKESLKLVLTILFKDNKPEPSTVDFPELGGVVITGDQMVAPSCARPTWPGCSVFGEWQEGMLRGLKCLRCTRDNEEQLLKFSSKCTDFAPCQAIGMESGHSSPPLFSQPPLRAPGRLDTARHVHNGPVTVAAPKMMLSAEPLMTSANPLMMSPGQLAASVEKLMPEHTSAAATALLAGQEGNAAADAGEGLPQQAQRAWGAEKWQDPETALQGFLDRQHSPSSPLDAIISLDVLAPPPISERPPSKSNRGVPSSGNNHKEDQATAARLPKLPAPGSCAKLGKAPDLATQPLVSAFAATASCPPNFFETNDKEDAAHVEDAFRTAKSYDWLVDELLDMSVSSLLTSSPRHVSSHLSRQHQQAHFGGVAAPNNHSPHRIDGR